MKVITLDQGKIDSEYQLNIISEWLLTVINYAVVADIEEISHWWLLKENGKKFMYFGTPDSFKDFVL